MFNALNRFISRLDGDDPRHRQQQQGGFGFQVLRNTNLELAIEPWFDFIVGINGRMIDDPDPGLFAQEVRNCAGGMLTLGLWSAKGQRTRTMHIPVPPTATLGLSLQWTPLSVVSNIWHVLDVPAGSPADAAGLLPYSDYVLGSPEGVLHGEAGLGEIVEDHRASGEPLRLHVYNSEYDVVRDVTIRPSRDWGGRGALGCVLGYGALHRLPAPLSEPVHAPGETLFDGAVGAGGGGGGGAGEVFDEKSGYYYGDAPGGDATTTTTSFITPADAAAAPPTAAGGGEFLVPAQMAAAATTTAPGTTAATAGPPRSHKKKDRHARGAPKSAMDDYFNEQEQKSRELEGASAASRSKSPIAPPPKAGGGPPVGGGPPRGGPPRADAAPQAEAEKSGGDGGGGGEAAAA